jgi:hypothetical protein
MAGGLARALSLPPNLTTGETDVGADIWLDRVWKPFEEQHAETICEAAAAEFREGIDNGDIDSIHAYSQNVYDAYIASGGYFRNGYNAGDIMWAMGLSWWGTVTPMLTDDGHLPVPRAKELLKMIEGRALTKERVSRHYLEHFTDGENKHPVTGPISTMVADENDKKLLPPDFDLLFAFLNERRDQLIALLHKSIELNEPLACSL